MKRNIKNIVVLDYDEDRVLYHKDNVIVIPWYSGENDDRYFYDIIPFMEWLADPKNDV